MTPQEHIQKAERLIAQAESASIQSGNPGLVIAFARAHLATAEAQISLAQFGPWRDDNA